MFYSTLSLLAWFMRNHINSYLCFSIGGYFFHLAYFKIFSLSLIFCTLKMICRGFDFFKKIYLVCCFFELPESVVWHLPLTWGNSQSLFQIFHFSFPSGIPIKHILYLLQLYCHSWMFCSDFSFQFFHFLFSFGGFY